MVDGASVLPPETKTMLETRLADVERQSKHQFVVVTVKSLGGHVIEDYSRTLLNSWGIGRKGYNDGVGLIVAPTERKVRIQVGYGLEKSLTDAEAGAIIEKDILPRFKAGDVPGGITAGSEAIIGEITQ
ncbi:TPM domain-containing protein [Sphingomonas sp. R-74633]|uniref:TPM domain-containing protein n=1 Tax=Sphingomonas sp. R-74633 TaxID=2751188 RepID=UPI0015D1EBBA|nr:TPM domain-containing protein [Sphingomonas sp. R-74633]